MLQIESEYNCCGCGACENICPKNAITMEEDEQGFFYPKINNTLCTNCGLCEKVCPIKNVKLQENQKYKAYAAKSKDLNIRMKSSSGGIFTEIAREILKEDGVVYGAIFDEKFEVIHQKVETEQDLEKIRGSKYIQSNIKDTYKEAKHILMQGRKVLFTGTPCQIEGLLRFLMKNYENLYTQDLICHGVPSKLAWRKYLEYRKEKDNENPEKITFRDKENKGWSNYEVSFKYSQKNININHNEDIFMQIFLSDIALRPSCYKCKFKKIHRDSDITLADFWGIDKIVPDMNDEKGTSLVIVNSKKGMDLFKKILPKIDAKEVTLKDALQYNKSMYQTPNKEKMSKGFCEDLLKEDIYNIREKYLKKQN